MSISIQMAQMLMLGFPGSHIDAVRAIHHWFDEGIGGVILYGHNVIGPEPLSRLTEALRARNGSEPTCFIAIDQEGGLVSRLSADKGFPDSPSAHAIAEEQIHIEPTAQQTAQLLRKHGLNFNLAPCVDVAINPKGFIAKKERSFSNNPNTVHSLARSMIHAHRHAGILTCLKHFPGHGSSDDDSHLGFVDISTSWRDEELRPFQKLISEGLADAVMPAHVFHRSLDPQFPASLSSKITTDILRKTLGFKGLIISDDLDMEALAQHYPLSERIALALDAGNDILLFSNHRGNLQLAQDLLKILMQLYTSGRLSEERIKTSLNRIAQAKGKIYPQEIKTSSL